MSTHTRLKVLSWIGTCIFIIVLSTVAYNTTGDASIEYSTSIVSTTSTAKTKPIKLSAAKEREVKLLSEYIKRRKNNSPKEVCDRIAFEIINQSMINNIPDEIVVGIIEIESMWDIYATSTAKAKGLMQILLEDGVDIDPDKSYDIGYNIEKGIQIFKSKMKKSNGDVSLALEYYVGGDKKYHKEVYKYLGMYTLYKINCSNKEISKIINIVERG